MDNLFRYRFDYKRTGVLVENKSLIASEKVEMHLYETVTPCENVHIKFSLPIIAFMVRGDKYVELEGVGRFKYEPWHSLLVPAKTNLKIDFPTASPENPTQCLAFVPEEELIQEAKYEYQGNIDQSKVGPMDQEADFRDGALLREMGIRRTVQNLFYLFQENNEYRDYFINLTTKELLVRILQSNARNSFLHHFNPSNNCMSFIARYIRDHIEEDLGIEQLADKAGMGRTTFYNQFKSIFGISPNQYIIQEKINKAKRMLVTDAQYSITEVAFSLGYSDSAYFARQFKECTGYSPSKFRKLHLLPG